MPVIVQSVPADRLSAGDIDRWRGVPVAVAVDIGRAEGQIDPAIRPIRSAGQQPRLFGRAVTVRCEPPDFGAVPLAVDRLGAGDVLVIAAGGHADTAMIGEVLGGHMRRRGAVGLICDGAIRDVGMLAGWNDVSVFTRHVTARGPSSAERGSINVPVVFGGVLIRPGDLVIGDDDGLVALGPDFVLARIGDAEAKLAREADWERSLADGRSLQETLGLAAAGDAPAPVASETPTRRLQTRGEPS